MELATQAIRQAKAFKKKVHEALEQMDDIPDKVEELLYQADAHVEKALEFYEQKNYAEALIWADKAIQYYQEILQLLT